MKKTFLMAALAGALALPAAAQTPSSAAPKAHKPAMTADKSAQSSTAVSAADKAFVREAAIGGMAEVDLGNLARKRLPALT